MELSRFQSDLKFANTIGSTLNIEEKMRLELSMMKLNESEQFCSISFWGKIEGVSNDYYIILV